MKQEIRFAGYGGQGVILAAVILAEAAGLYENKEVAQTQSYGPEARGGAARADVVISDNAITYPPESPNRILWYFCLLPPPTSTCRRIAPRGWFSTIARWWIFLKPISTICLAFRLRSWPRMSWGGNKICANIVMLGGAVVGGASRIASMESLKKRH